VIRFSIKLALVAALGAPVAAAAADFTCSSPSHHDGDAIRCRGNNKSMRLFGIDAPEMPGSCRPGRACTPGDPYAARDYLARITAGRTITCKRLSTDHYGRAIVRCAADGADLSCAMVAAGHAVERYGRLRCGGAAASMVVDDRAATQLRRAETQSRRAESQSRRAETQSRRAKKQSRRAKTPAAPEKRYFAPAVIEKPLDLGWLWIALPLWLIFINTASWFAMATDKRRALEQVRRPVVRMPETTLLLMAAAGGSAATYAAQQKLRHKTRKQPFAIQLLVIIGLQIGAIIGWLLWPVMAV